MFGGIKKDGFQALRKVLMDFEDVSTGTLPEEFYVRIPVVRQKEMNDLCQIYGDNPIFDVPLKP